MDVLKECTRGVEEYRKKHSQNEDRIGFMADVSTKHKNFARVAFPIWMTEKKT